MTTALDYTAAQVADLLGVSRSRSFGCGSSQSPTPTAC